MGFNKRKKRKKRGKNKVLKEKVIQQIVEVVKPSFL